MIQKIISCFKCVDGELVRNGNSASGKQRFFCKNCKRTQIINYTYKACLITTNNSIVLLTKEGLGIRSTARILQISTTTLLKRILTIADAITLPTVSKGKSYEVDEMRSYIKQKKNLIWIVYALENRTKEVVSFAIDPRTNKTLNTVIKTLKKGEAKTIYTDGLKNYLYLIDKKIHSTKRYANNHIERNNLSIRTHLKRLNRRTICFSKSKTILRAILKIYFWA
jgi:insertion element IS1 protein InsB